MSRTYRHQSYRTEEGEFQLDPSLLIYTVQDGPYTVLVIADTDTDPVLCREVGKRSPRLSNLGTSFAEFTRLSPGHWDDTGNGCRGVDRNAVVKSLNLHP